MIISPTQIYLAYWVKSYQINSPTYSPAHDEYFFIKILLYKPI